MYVVEKGAIIGLISGVILGLFLKVIEVLTQVKVYTLLLNVDYIPYLNTYTFPEVVEFTFHLVISVLLGILFMWVAEHFSWEKEQVMFRVVMTSFLIGLFLFPTTALSTKTPPITSIEAIIYWLFGHLLYGCVVSWLMVKEMKGKKKPAVY